MRAAIARGLEGVVLTETRTSQIDGDAGELVIGGFSVEELSARARFEEVVFLLWHDRLPRRAELGARAGDGGLYADALRVEEVTLRVLEELRQGRRIQTNVEFYTALLLHGLGLGTPLFTPTFAAGRISGWTAHALEQARENRLIRPRVAYAGERARRWVPADARL